jgi:hypothetical protein
MAAGLALGAAGLVFAQSAPHLIERGIASAIIPTMSRSC